MDAPAGRRARVVGWILGGRRRLWVGRDLCEYIRMEVAPESFLGDFTLLRLCWYFGRDIDYIECI